MDYLTGLCSMATKELLSHLAEELGESGSTKVDFECAGGLEVARRVREGIRADVLVLAENSMADLASERLVDPGTVRAVFVSQVVAAVPKGRPGVPLDTEDDLRRALSNAHRIGYSTGPSGSSLRELIQRWGLTTQCEHRLVQAPPGVPVGLLLAQHEVDIGFQQLSELADVAGVTVLGPLPGGAAISTTFSGGVLTSSTHAQSASQVIAFLCSSRGAQLARAHGMAPATLGA